MRKGPSIINPFDLHALEAAIQIREKLGGKVTVLTMGRRRQKLPSEMLISMGLMRRCFFQTGPLQAPTHGRLHTHLHRR